MSLVIAVTASYISILFASKVFHTTGKAKMVWLLSGAIILGSGVWAMHFVGMLAMDMGVHVHYQRSTTLLSAFASIFASLFAFLVASEPRTNILEFGLGGLFMGGGIATMHYTGMAAMHSDMLRTHDPLLVTISILIALVASYTSLYLFRKFRNSPDFSKWKFLSALIMGLAISGMHYVGIAAEDYYIAEGMGFEQTVADEHRFLLIGVLIVIFTILVAAFVIIFFDRNVLERMAYSDHLTGLPNRSALIRYFNQTFKKGTSGAVLFMDIDRFKVINDTLGHDIGDFLLQQVAARLHECTENKQLVFRLGGDEFLIVSTIKNSGAHIVLAERILESINQPYYIGKHELYVTPSIGISLAPQHGSDHSSLMKAADKAMYYSKAIGKNTYSVFNEEMERQQIRMLGLEKDISKALAQGEFYLVYQQKWNARTNEVVGMEALLRWYHPEHGLISPDEFIPIAEDTRIIIPLTRWILQDVCLKMKTWQTEKIVSVPVSVNISVQVFESLALIEMIEMALNQSGVDPRYLELEITESIAMTNAEKTIEQLDHVRSLGIKVSIDDFGTGYSSLWNLDEVPVDILKIDKLFIQNIDVKSKQAIIKSIVTIANNLQLEVVAEGVETAEQADFLQSIGCDIMQGNYYGNPIPAQEISKKWVTGQFCP